jgi:MoaA/NifB/PqqE/SkfB family radical SAM enzyme
VKRIWRITLLTNPDVCNLDCLLCFLRQRKRDFGMGEMSWTVAERAVRKYAGEGAREVIPSTMGEPLLYTQFDRLERLVQELGLKLNVTTNGSFPLKGAERWGRELLPISNDIKVSCWGVEKSAWENLCPGMPLKAYFENLKTLARVKKELSLQTPAQLASLTLQMAVSKSNRKDVENVLELAADLNFDRVKLNRAVFLSDTAARIEALPPEDFWDAGKMQGKFPLRLEGTFLQNPAERSPLRECPFLDREVWILPDGSVEPCPDPGARFGTKNSEDRCERCLLFPKNGFAKS